MINQRNAPTRVCFLTEKFYPEVKDGCTYIAYQLADSLILKHAELFVIARKMERESKRRELVGNVPVKRIPPVGRLKGKGWKAVLPLLRLVTVMPLLLVRYINRYDIILVSGVKILSIPAVLIGIIFDKISVIRIESPSELREDISSESLRRMNLSGNSSILKLLRRVRNPLIRRADCFVAISPEIRQQLMDIGIDSNKIVSIANGVDIRRFSPSADEIRSRLRQKLSLPRDAVIAIYTGRLVVSKGVLTLVEVWNQLLASHDNIHLLLVGSGDGWADNCEGELNSYITQNKIERHVSFTGNVDNVNEYLMASNIFVMPSDFEGFSLALLEALACALPSIATNVGGACEVIQDCVNGLLVEPRDPQGLKTAIEWMLEHHDQWDAMGRKARESAERYSMEAVADEYMALFRRLQEGRNHGAG